MNSELHPIIASEQLPMDSNKPIETIDTVDKDATLNNGQGIGTELKKDSLMSPPAKTTPAKRSMSESSEENAKWSKKRRSTERFLQESEALLKSLGVDPTKETNSRRTRSQSRGVETPKVEIKPKTTSNSTGRRGRKAKATIAAEAAELKAASQKETIQVQEINKPASEVAVNVPVQESISEKKIEEPFSEKKEVVEDSVVVPTVDTSAELNRETVSESLTVPAKEPVHESETKTVEKPTVESTDESPALVISKDVPELEADNAEAAHVEESVKKTAEVKSVLALSDAGEPVAEAVDTLSKPLDVVFTEKNDEKASELINGAAITGSVDVKNVVSAAQ